MTKALPKMDRAAVVAIRKLMISLVSEGKIERPAIECAVAVIKDADERLADPNFV